MKIQKLTLYTNNLSEQVKFYTEVLNLEILEQTAQKVAFKIGDSVLIFEEKEDAKPYHFAINIPSNKEKEALNWLKQRVTILKYGKLEIQDFDFWNAKAVYFYDADHNIVEFIARKNLENESEKPFDETQLLEISEIGLTVNDIESVFNFLHNTCQLSVYSGSFGRFCAIGGEHGLFICVNKQKKEWFPTNDKIFLADFKVSFQHLKRDYKLAFEGGNFNLLA